MSESGSDPEADNSEHGISARDGNNGSPVRWGNLFAGVATGGGCSLLSKLKAGSLQPGAPEARPSENGTYGVDTPQGAAAAIRPSRHVPCRVGRLRSTLPAFGRIHACGSGAAAIGTAAAAGAQRPVLKQLNSNIATAALHSGPVRPSCAGTGTEPSGKDGLEAPVAQSGQTAAASRCLQGAPAGTEDGAVAAKKPAARGVGPDATSFGAVAAYQAAETDPSAALDRRWVSQGPTTIRPPHLSQPIQKATHAPELLLPPLPPPPSQQQQQSKAVREPQPRPPSAPSTSAAKAAQPQRQQAARHTTVAPHAVLASDAPALQTSSHPTPATLKQAQPPTSSLRLPRPVAGAEGPAAEPAGVAAIDVGPQGLLGRRGIEESAASQLPAPKRPAITSTSSGGSELRPDAHACGPNNPRVATNSSAVAQPRQLPSEPSMAAHSRNSLDDRCAVHEVSLSRAAQQQQSNPLLASAGLGDLPRHDLRRERDLLTGSRSSENASNDGRASAESAGMPCLEQQQQQGPHYAFPPPLMELVAPTAAAPPQPAAYPAAPALDAQPHQVPSCPETGATGPAEMPCLSALGERTQRATAVQPPSSTAVTQGQQSLRAAASLAPDQRPREEGDGSDRLEPRATCLKGAPTAHRAPADREPDRPRSVPPREAGGGGVAPETGPRVHRVGVSQLKLGIEPVSPRGSGAPGAAARSAHHRRASALPPALQGSTATITSGADQAAMVAQPPTQQRSEAASATLADARVPVVRTLVDQDGAAAVTSSAGKPGMSVQPSSSWQQGSAEAVARVTDPRGPVVTTTPRQTSAADTPSGADAAQLQATGAHPGSGFASSSKVITIAFPGAVHAHAAAVVMRPSSARGPNERPATAATSSAAPFDPGCTYVNDASAAGALVWGSSQRAELQQVDSSTGAARPVRPSCAGICTEVALEDSLAPASRGGQAAPQAWITPGASAAPASGGQAPQAAATKAEAVETSGPKYPPPLPPPRPPPKQQQRSRAPEVSTTAVAAAVVSAPATAAAAAVDAQWKVRPAGPEPVAPHAALPLEAPKQPSSVQPAGPHIAHSAAEASHLRGINLLLIAADLEASRTLPTPRTDLDGPLMWGRRAERTKGITRARQHAPTAVAQLQQPARVIQKLASRKRAHNINDGGRELETKARRLNGAPKASEAPTDRTSGRPTSLPGRVACSAGMAALEADPRAGRAGALPPPGLQCPAAATLAQHQSPLQGSAAAGGGAAGPSSQQGAAAAAPGLEALTVGLDLFWEDSGASACSKRLEYMEVCTNTIWLTTEMCAGLGVFSGLLGSTPDRTEEVTLVPADTGELQWKVTIEYDTFYEQYTVPLMEKVFTHFGAAAGDVVVFRTTQIDKDIFTVSVLRAPWRQAPAGGSACATDTRVPQLTVPPAAAAAFAAADRKASWRSIVPVEAYWAGDEDCPRCEPLFEDPRVGKIGGREMAMRVHAGVEPDPGAAVHLDEARQIRMGVPEGERKREGAGEGAGGQRLDLGSRAVRFERDGRGGRGQPAFGSGVGAEPVEGQVQRAPRDEALHTRAPPRASPPALREAAARERPQPPPAAAAAQRSESRGAPDGAASTLLLATAASAAATVAGAGTTAAVPGGMSAPAIAANPATVVNVTEGPAVAAGRPVGASGSAGSSAGIVQRSGGGDGFPRSLSQRPPPAGTQLGLRQRVKAALVSLLAPR